MIEVDLFKRSYFEGRLVLIHGPPGTRKIRMAYELLGHCQVDEHEVHRMSANDFADRFVASISQFVLRGIRVFLVHRLEELDERKHSEFLAALNAARKLHFSCGIRVILIQSNECELAEKIRERFLVMQMRVTGCHRDNLDERVHWAIELACRVTQKRVTHISSEAAQFLEKAGEKFQDDGLLQALVYAVHRSSHGVLRLDDFFQSDKLKPRPSDDAASCCT